MKLIVKKLHPEAKLPSFAQAGDVGMDLYSVEDLVLKPGQRASCHTGIAIKIPDGYAGLIWDKSGPSHKFGIKNLGGVFDNNYTGEYLIGLVNLGQENYEIKKGQKIAQLLIQKIESPEILEGEIEENTPRQDKGFGSTGLF